MTATDLGGEWSPRVLTGLALTDKLHASYDVYTNMATKYEGAYVFFPSIYYHFSSDPHKSANSDSAAGHSFLVAHARMTEV